MTKGKASKLLANSSGQWLDCHSVAVASVASYIDQTYFPEKEGTKRDSVSIAVALGGLFHDAGGKCFPSFQAFLKTPEKSSKKAKLANRHHELAWIVFKIIQNEIKINSRSLSPYEKKLTEAVVYLHHKKCARPTGRLGGAKIGYDGGYETLSDFVKNLAPKDAHKDDDKIFSDAALGNINEVMKDLSSRVSSTAIGPVLSIDLPELAHENVCQFFSDDKLGANFSSFAPSFKRERREGGLDYNFNRDFLYCLSVVKAADHVVSAAGDRLFGDDWLARLKTDATEALFPKPETKEKTRASISDVKDRYLKTFPGSSKTKQQLRLVEELRVAEARSPGGIYCYSLAAGDGKTLSALLSILAIEAEGAVWSGPDLTITTSNLFDLTRQSAGESISTVLYGANVEIITGESKGIYKNPEIQSEEPATFSYQNKKDRFPSLFDESISLCTIDQLAALMRKPAMAINFLKFLLKPWISDEIHKHRNISMLNIATKELVDVRKAFSPEPTILMTATPNPIFLTYLDENLIESGRLLMGVAQNPASYKINVHEYDSPENYAALFSRAASSLAEKTVCFIHNSVDAAQYYYLTKGGDRALSLHSRFTKNDSKKIMDAVYRSFGKDKCVDHYDSLRGSAKPRTGLNISFDRGVTDVSSPEDYLQFVGRILRFATDSSQEGQLDVVMAKGYGREGFARKSFSPSCGYISNPLTYLEKISKSANASRSFVPSLFELSERSKDASLSLSEIYEVYYKFYGIELSGDKKTVASIDKDAPGHKAALIDWQALVKKDEINYLDKDGFFPVAFMNKKGDEFTSKSNLRGSSYYVNCLEIDSNFSSLGYLYDYKELLRLEEQEEKSEYFRFIAENCLSIEKSWFGFKAKGGGLVGTNVRWTSALSAEASTALRPCAPQCAELKIQIENSVGEITEWSIKKAASKPSYPIFISFNKNDLEIARQAFPSGGRYRMRYLRPKSVEGRTDNVVGLVSERVIELVKAAD